MEGMEMKVLVTGNLGYNGCPVVELLEKQGHEVVGIDTEYFKSNFMSLANSAPTKQLSCDIREIQEEQLSGIDAVVHLAALSNDALGEIDKSLTDEINFKASVRLAKLAKKAGAIKFIYASSCSVYGISDPSQYATETSPLNPLTAYAKAKINTEKEIEKLHDDHFTIVNMRNATMHGVSPKLRLDLVVNNLVASAYIYDKIKILSDGTPWRPLLSVSDFANFIHLFLKKEKPSHITYNIGFTKENYRILELGNIISQITGAEVDVNKNKTPDERSYRVSFERLESEFGEDPIDDVPSSVKKLKLAYEENGLSEDIFNSSKYFRIRTLKELINNGSLNHELKWAK